jgi:hypothetical protein
MTHERKSELNRVLRDGVDPDIPYGLPSDDLHPDGEANTSGPPPGAPEAGTKLDQNASVDWGEAPGEETIDRDREKPDEAA